MASKMDTTQVALLREFVKVVAGKPEILHLPELAFFKEWLLKLGANIPPLPEPDVKPKPSEPGVVDTDDMETSSSAPSSPSAPPVPPTQEETKEPKSPKPQEATVSSLVTQGVDGMLYLLFVGIG